MPGCTISPATRSQAAYDNSVASSRWVSGAYGPHTCVQGYVWREAFLGDDVCVLRVGGHDLGEPAPLVPPCPDHGMDDEIDGEA